MFFFQSIKTKYARNEKKIKNWKFYINTVKNVSTASHKLPHFFIRACFHSKKIKHKKFGAARLIFVETGKENLEGSEFYPTSQLKWS